MTAARDALAATIRSFAPCAMSAAADAHARHLSALDDHDEAIQDEIEAMDAEWPIRKRFLEWVCNDAHIDGELLCDVILWELHEGTLTERRLTEMCRDFNDHLRAIAEKRIKARNEDAEANYMAQRRGIEL